MRSKDIHPGEAYAIRVPRDPRKPNGQKVVLRGVRGDAVTAKGYLTFLYDLPAQGDGPLALVHPRSVLRPWKRHEELAKGGMWL